MQISARLARAGWRTRFVSQAIADNRVADRLDDYWHQHVRWTRNLFASARSRPLLGGQSSAGLPQRIECWMAAAGYIDRLALFAAAALAFTGLLPAWLPAAYLAVLAVEVAVAVAKEGVTRRLPVFLTAVIALFWVDLLASAAGTLAYLLRRPGRWLPSQRQLRQADQG